jgi:twinfilin-like protein
MATLSVVQIPEEVSSAFANARASNNIRFLQISLNMSDETTPFLQLVHTQRATNSFANDFDSIVSQVTDPKLPFFFLVRLENPSEWVLVWYVPDNSKVRQKMLFSSTVNHLKSTLGNQYLIGDYHTTSLSELSYKEFAKGWTHPSKRHEYNPDLLTEKERISEIERSGESNFSGPTKVGVHGLDLPASDNVQRRVAKLAAKQVSHVGLTIDSEKEFISLITEQDATTIEQVRALVSPKEPSYHIFVYKQQTYFVYACPTQSKVKQRMIYSATKSSILNYLANQGVKIDRNVEISDPEDFTEQTLLPQDTSNLNKIQKLSKPKRPGRGAARLTKAGTEDNDS